MDSCVATAVSSVCAVSWSAFSREVFRKLRHFDFACQRFVFVLSLSGKSPHQRSSGRKDGEGPLEGRNGDFVEQLIEGLFMAIPQTLSRLRTAQALARPVMSWTPLSRKTA